jgi:hypothetical protein
MTTSNHLSAQSLAKTIGLFWLLTIITGMFSFVTGGRLIVEGNAALTAANITAHESLYRLSFVANLGATLCYIVVTLFAYVLFKPVNKNLSLLGAFFSLMGCATGVTSSVLFLAPLHLLGPGAGALTAGQLQSQVLALTATMMQANDLGLMFFGCHVAIIGYLIRRSTFLPNFLGVLLSAAAICYWTNGLASFLALPFRSYLMPLVALGGLGGEGAFTAWLLIKGVNVARWNEHALPVESIAR